MGTWSIDDIKEQEEIEELEGEVEALRTQFDALVEQRRADVKALLEQYKDNPGPTYWKIPMLQTIKRLLRLPLKAH